MFQDPVSSPMAGFTYYIVNTFALILQNNPSPFTLVSQLHISKEPAEMFPVWFSREKVGQVEEADGLCDLLGYTGSSEIARHQLHWACSLASYYQILSMKIKPK